MRNTDSFGVLIDGHRIFMVTDAWGNLQFVHTMMYEHQKNRDSFYMCGYISIDRATLSRLSYDDTVELGITFEGIHAPWLEIPAAWDENRSLVNYSYWIGVDRMSLPEDQQPTAEEMRDQLVELTRKIKERIGA